MKQVFGLLLIVVGVFVGLYVGGYICLIGGITDLITAAKAETVIAADVGWAIGKIVLAQFVGVISASLFFIPAIGLLK